MKSTVMLAMLHRLFQFFLVVGKLHGQDVKRNFSALSSRGGSVLS
jgi:hypothetical protein